MICRGSSDEKGRRKGCHTFEAGITAKKKSRPGTAEWRPALVCWKNTLFHQLDGYITAKPSHLNAKGSLACVMKDGNIYVNMRANLSPEQWCYVMAHNLLHLAFGHFDKASILPTANLSRHSGTKPVISTLPDSFMTSASASRFAQIRRKHIRSN